MSERLLNIACDVKEQGTAELAFLGDAVYELLVREKLVGPPGGSVGALNQRKIALVNCKAQFEAMDKLSGYLTEDEAAIFRRGRNMSGGRVPKHAERMHYSYATGLEVLLGYLYLKNEIGRIRQLFSIIIGED